MEIVVTGASRGIGSAIVKYLDQTNEHRVFALSRNKSKLEELKRQCGSNTKVFAVDLTSTDAESKFAECFADIDKIDLIVNNAGQLINKPFLETTAEEFSQQFKANVISSVKLIKFLYPLLLKSEAAHIVNISSMGGYQGSSKFPGLSAYSTSKGALTTLTECLAEEFSKDNIAVNALALGSVRTEMLKAAFPALDIGSDVEEMAKYIADFGLNGHRFYNGKILPVSNSTP